MRYYLNINTERLDGNHKGAEIKGIYNFYGFINKGWRYESKISSVTAGATVLTEFLFFPGRLAGPGVCILHAVLIFILCRLLFALCRQVVTMEKIYKEFATALGEPIIIRGIYAYNDADNSKMENPEIVPGIEVVYDCNVFPKDQMAVMFKLDEDSYGIVSFLDCSKIEGNLSCKIPANVVFNAIRHYNDECVSDQNVSMLAIGRVDASKKEYDKISSGGMNNDIFITELVWLPNFKRKGT